MIQKSMRERIEAGLREQTEQRARYSRDRNDDVKEHEWGGEHLRKI